MVELAETLALPKSACSCLWEPPENDPDHACLKYQQACLGEWLSRLISSKGHRHVDRIRILYHVVRKGGLEEIHADSWVEDYSPTACASTVLFPFAIVLVFVRVCVATFALARCL